MTVHAPTFPGKEDISEEMNMKKVAIIFLALAGINSSWAASPSAAGEIADDTNKICG